MLSHAGTSAEAGAIAPCVAAGIDTAAQGMIRPGQFSAVVCEGTVSDVQVVHRGGIRYSSRMRRMRVLSALDNAEAEIEEDGSDAGGGVRLNAHGLYVCRHCRNIYRRKAAMEVHEADCRQTEQDRTVLERGASMALDMFNERNLGIYTSVTTHPELRDVDATVATEGGCAVSA